MNQKTRSDSTFANLPVSQREQLEEWLSEPENLSYKQAADRLRLDFEISVAPSSICSWWVKRREELKLEVKLQELVDGANATNRVVSVVEANPSNGMEGIMAQVRQKVFNLLLQGAEEKTVAAFTKLLIAKDRLDFQKDTLEVIKEKFRHSIQTDIETGLEAFTQTIQDSPEAMALMVQIREIVAKATAKK
jgi:hypothetical protein